MCVYMPKCFCTYTFGNTETHATSPYAEIDYGRKTVTVDKNFIRLCTITGHNYRSQLRFK